MLWGMSVGLRSILVEVEPLIASGLTKLQCTVSLLDVGRNHRILNSSNDAWSYIAPGKLS